MARSRAHAQAQRRAGHNARPGLAIQIANQAGLKPHLERVERERHKLKSVAGRVAFARKAFAHRV